MLTATICFIVYAITVYVILGVFSLNGRAPRGNRRAPNPAKRYAVLVGGERPEMRLCGSVAELLQATKAPGARLLAVRDLKAGTFVVR